MTTRRKEHYNNMDLDQVTFVRCIISTGLIHHSKVYGQDPSSCKGDVSYCVYVHFFQSQMFSSKIKTECLFFFCKTGRSMQEHTPDRTSLDELPQPGF